MDSFLATSRESLTGAPVENDPGTPRWPSLLRLAHGLRSYGAILLADMRSAYVTRTRNLLAENQTG